MQGILENLVVEFPQLLKREGGEINKAAFEFTAALPHTTASLDHADIEDTYPGTSHISRLSTGYRSAQGRLRDRDRERAAEQCGGRQGLHDLWAGVTADGEDYRPVRPFDRPGRRVEDEIRSVVGHL